MVCSVRVLLVIHDFLPYHSGGSEIATYHLARALRRRGVDARLVFAERRDDREQFSISTGSHDGIPFHEVVYNHRFEDFEEMYDHPGMERAFERVLAEVRPDVVHFESLVVFGLGCIRAAKRARVPVAVTLHDYWLLCPRGGLLMMADETLCPDRTADQCAACMEIYPLRPEKYGAEPRAFDRRAVFAKAVERRMERVRATIPIVDLLTSPSRFLREMMLKHGFPADRLAVSDNGFESRTFTARRAGEVTPERSDVDPEGRRVRLGYIGGLTPWKGVHLLLEACRALPAGRFRVGIWGDRTWFPDYVARLDRLAEGLPVTFHGTYANDAVARLLAGLDAIVVPSVWYENSPMTIHEAQLARVPVLATDLGGMSEFVADGWNGLLFRRNDAGDLAAKLRALVDEPARLEPLRRGPRIPIKSCDEDAAEWAVRYSALLARA
jgi:glycosyltransferase involved in cell wall biosynthesis